MLFASVIGYAQTISVAGEAERFDHYWSVGTCAGRVNEGLRLSWCKQLKQVHDCCGFQYLRMHGLFDDDMFVYSEDAEGHSVYNWQYIDEVYDHILDIGVRPFVELSFFPLGIAKDNSKVQMWYQNRVSFDESRLEKWKGLVHAFVMHAVGRYGLSEVRKWYFEVWNEPNLNVNPKAGFFDGTKSDYFKLYTASAEAVKSVDGMLKVGGPATSNFVADNRYEGEVYDKNKSHFYPHDQINKQQWKGTWIEDFLSFCGKKGLPVDFISCHPYPTDYALDPESGRSLDAVRYVNSLSDDITWLKKTLAASKYPAAEIHLTEWSTSPNSRDKMHDLLPTAAYIMRCVLDNLNRVNSLMYWTFTDIFEEKGGGASIFHGGFGQINFQGLVKPSFHAFRMLNQLGDQKLYYKDGVFVSRFSSTGKISSLIFNYPKEYEDRVPSSADSNRYMEASRKPVDVVLTGMAAGAVISVETLDKTHGNVYEEYVKMGMPKSPGIEETEYLKTKSLETQKTIYIVGKDGTFTYKGEMDPWTCVLIKQL